MIDNNSTPRTTGSILDTAHISRSNRFALLLENSPNPGIWQTCKTSTEKVKKTRVKLRCFTEVTAAINRSSTWTKDGGRGWRNLPIFSLRKTKRIGGVKRNNGINVLYSIIHYKKLPYPIIPSEKLSTIPVQISLFRYSPKNIKPIILLFQPQNFHNYSYSIIPLDEQIKCCNPRA